MLGMKTHTFVSHSVCHRSPSNVSHLFQGGPRWEISRTPRKLIVVRDAHAESQSFGTAHTFYEVETKVWSTHAVCQVNADCLKLCIIGLLLQDPPMTVSRRYKHFLWLYDKLADSFPCVSLPPIPVKQLAG